jgi:CheY-like chemotaxis protein
VNASQGDRTPVVLIVDDEPPVVRVMSRTLERAGFQVATATSGLQAIAIASELPAPPDIVVSDLRMEPVDGSALARLILAIWPDTRFLFVSGFRPSEAFQDLPGAVLPKPFSPAQLVELVRQLCNTTRSSSRLA